MTRTTSDPTALENEAGLVDRLRDGDERAFMLLVEQLHPSMVRLARTFVPSHAVAEEVAQEAWVGVLTGLERFEGRSSLKTWIMRIVTNQAIRRGERERRSVPFSSLARAETEGDDPAVSADMFLPHDNRWAGHWAGAPQPFPDPEEHLLRAETVAAAEQAIAQLPPAQRAVITLRDIEDWDPQEVCSCLEISESNQRVLLHRARSKVRAALDNHFQEART